MAASNPSGEMAFWDSGFPFLGVQIGTTDVGEMQYWDSGFPMQYQFPAAVPPPPTVTTTRFLSLLGAGS